MFTLSRGVTFTIVAVPALAFVIEAMAQPASDDHMRAPKSPPMQNVPVTVASPSTGISINSVTIAYQDTVVLDQITDVEYDATPVARVLYTSCR